jgi:hypothetical protein
MIYDVYGIFHERSVQKGFLVKNQDKNDKCEVYKTWGQNMPPAIPGEF